MITTKFWTQVFTIVVAGVLTSGVIYAIRESKIIHKVNIPEGAILPFDLEECPETWSPFDKVEGRFILGYGDSDDNLTPRNNLGEIGGVEKHQLTTSEIPSHSHSYYDYHYSDSATGSDDYETPSGDGQGNITGNKRVTSSQGGGAAHENMPPYIVLLYCRKN
ncbi:phage tail protein [Crocosphaera sp. Alani8]|uniref:phage tail protein n=1 Tax=Crocosphaera sp. Alani8 TaxID=3038952 RepID=UPI00313DC454